MTDERSHSGTPSRTNDSGAGDVVEVVDETAGNSPLAGLSEISPKDSFTGRAATVTSSLLTLLGYTLNWYSYTHWGKEYFPDWALGLCWAPWGVRAVALAKQHLTKPKKP